MTETLTVVYANDEAYVRDIIRWKFSHETLPLSDAAKDDVGAIAAKALIDDMNERGIGLAYKPNWHVFDKDDPSTWPTTADTFWVSWVLPASDQRVVGYEDWDFGTWGTDEGIDFWMPIQTPEPPQ